MDAMVQLLLDSIDYFMMAVVLSPLDRSLSRGLADV
jgi:hypothetical protein